MKKNTFKTAAVIAATLTFGLAACKKEPVLPKKENHSTSETPATAKNGIYSEGILSNNGYSGATDVIVGYYQFWGPSPGQQTPGLYTCGSDYGTAEVIGCGAATKYYAYAYKTSAGIQFLEGSPFVNTYIRDAASNIFLPVIEEIEIHPQTLEIYALVKEGNSKRIYVIDRFSGVATLVTVNGASAIFNNPAGNGYKCGSITFVPDGSGGYEFVFSSESTVYAHLGVVSWHFSLSGTNLTSLVSKHRLYKSIPGTVGSGINTTYGNGKLYFTRERGSVLLANPLYSLSLASDTFAYEGFGIYNRNDFGYWKAF